MQRLMLLSFATLLLAGCGTTSQLLSGRVNANRQVAGQATASDRSAVLAALTAQLAAHHPGVKLTVSADRGWMELGEAETPGVLKFDVMTTVTGAPGSDNQAEFYGFFDSKSRSLVPATLWIGAKTQATHAWLNAH